MEKNPNKVVILLSLLCGEVSNRFQQYQWAAWNLITKIIQYENNFVIFVRRQGFQQRLPKYEWAARFPKTTTKLEKRRSICFQFCYQSDCFNGDLSPNSDNICVPKLTKKLLIDSTIPIR